MNVSLTWYNILATCVMFAILLTQMKSSKLSTSFCAGQCNIQQAKKLLSTTHKGRLWNSIQPSCCGWLVIRKKNLKWWNDMKKVKSGLMGVSKFAARELFICNIGHSKPTVREQSELYLDFFSLLILLGKKQLW